MRERSGIDRVTISCLVPGQEGRPRLSLQGSVLSPRRWCGGCARSAAAAVAAEALLALARRRSGLDEFGDTEFLDPLRRLAVGVHGRGRRSAWSGGWRRAGTWCGSSPTCCASRTPRRAIPASCGSRSSGRSSSPACRAAAPPSCTDCCWRTRTTGRRCVWQTIYPYPPRRGPGCAAGARGAAAARLRAAGAGVPRAASARCHLAAGVQRDHRACVPQPAVRHDLSHPELPATGWISASHVPAYRFHRRFLQHLQHQAPGGRWVLKCPDHLFALDAIRAEYTRMRGWCSCIAIP